MERNEMRVRPFIEFNACNELEKPFGKVWNTPCSFDQVFDVGTFVVI